jgi:hypothetical protein
MIDLEKKEKISWAVIKTLYAKFSDFPEDASNNRNAPFHEAFLKAFEDKFSGKVSDIPFFISLSSWFHGLNTTLGQSFFEKVAHILSNGSKKEFKGLKISEKQQTMISDIMTELKNGVHPPNLKRENDLIFKDNRPQNKCVPNSTVDCYYDDDESIVAIELKTVKPNSSVFKSEKEKFLEAKSGLKNSYPNKVIYYYLAFPFDPTSESPTGSDKSNFLSYSVDFKKFFAEEEILLADELWNFLSDDENTMQQIIDIVNSIASSEFMDRYEFLNEHTNKTNDMKKYLKLLEDWNLLSENELAQDDKKITEKLELKENIRLSRTYNQPIFKDGIYNADRYTALRRLI